MAIDNRTQLANTKRKIASLELALEEMKRDESPEGHAVLSEGFIAQIEQMRRETREYLCLEGGESKIPTCEG